MKTKNILILGIVIIIIVSIHYSFSGGESSEFYVTNIQKLREEKNLNMRTPGSPFAGDSTNSFKGLNYFPINEHYKINARLTPIPNKKTVLLPTSDGEEKSYLEYAYAEFELEGVQNKLLILEITEMGPYRGTLFLAFADETSANETYGAGRYLDIKKTPGSQSVNLDFNQAYNPYCAYNDNYSCPFPPRENILKVAIKAGEKSYK
jgi:uncharacterized protein (DUF1684 family)